MRRAALAFIVLTSALLSGCSNQPGPDALPSDRAQEEQRHSAENFSYSGTTQGAICVGPLSCPSTASSENDAFEIPHSGHEPLRLNGTVDLDEPMAEGQEHHFYLMVREEDGDWGGVSEEFYVRGNGDLTFDWNLSRYNATDVFGLAVVSFVYFDANRTGASYYTPTGFVVRATLEAQSSE